MNKDGTTFLAIFFAAVLIAAASGAYFIDRELTIADRQNAQKMLESVSITAGQQVELAIAAGHSGNAEQFIEAIVNAQPRLAARLERPGQRNPVVFGLWAISNEAIQIDQELGVAHESPPMARLSFRIDPTPPFALARTILVAISLAGPIGGLALASIHTRSRHHRIVAKAQSILHTRVDTLHETRGRELGDGFLEPELEAKFDELASLVASMAAYKEFFTNALQSMVDSLLIVNAEGVMLAVNQAVVDTLGYREEDLLGKNVSIFWADEKGFLLNGDRLRKILADGARNDLSLTFRTRAGKKVPVSLSGSAIRSRSGEITGYVCIAVNITERKKAEHEKEKLNQELVDTSRRAGMAEVATGVLHNVGNVLNSVTVTASSITSLISKSRVTRLSQIAQMFESHRDDLAGYLTEDPKGKKIPGYLGSLAETLESEQVTMLGEIDELNKNIEHIKKVITVQQRVARVSGVTEPVDTAELIADAIRIRESSYSKHKIRLMKDFTLTRPLHTDKHKVLQILVNLVGNAIDAMSDYQPDGQPAKRILSLRVVRCADDAEFAEISVSDTGPGIAHENMTRIFTHGFTTKKTGHGFGLHSAAIAARELGGSLTCRNRDHGTGATFTLRLPLERRDQANTTEIAA